MSIYIADKIVIYIFNKMREKKVERRKTRYLMYPRANK